MNDQLIEQRVGIVRVAELLLDPFKVETAQSLLVFRQLRGECGERQVAGADVSVWANAVGPFAGAMLLTKS